MSEDWKQYLQQAIDSSADSGYAESWRPEEGETIVGEVVAMETVDTRYGASEVMTLRTEDGDIAVWLTSVLKDLVATNHVGEGSKLAVRYDGKVTNKAGTSEYKTFTLQLYQETEVVGAEQPF